MEPTRTSSPLPPQPQTSTTAALRIRSAHRRRDNLLLDLPIAGRLTLGFFTAAVIASLITGIIGVVRSQSLGRQSDFYQSLLQTNTSLTTGADFLQLLNIEVQQAVNATNGPNPSQETITADLNAIQGLTDRYRTLINQYTANNLLGQHPDQVSLLAEGNHTSQVTQQRPLVDSTLRTWQVYQAAQEQILHDIQTGDIATAQNFWRVQGEPTNADAQSALHALIRFDQRLASSIRDAASVEQQNQVISTIVGAVIAFFLIVGVGWLISNTLVQRLEQLRQITQAVEQGQLSARVPVVGRDEIADVAASFNGMLETIVGLLKETRQQRDALTNAADHLFSDMRVVSSGDLRVNAAVSNDPIGMLANAFNFTVGRFRRFVLRVQGSVEQLDVISRQALEHSENFSQASSVYTQATSMASSTNGSNSAWPSSTIVEGSREPEQGTDDDNLELIAQLQHMRSRLQQLSSAGISKHTHSMQSLIHKTNVTAEQLGRTVFANAQAAGLRTDPTNSNYQEELQTLKTLLQYITLDLQSMQNNVTNGFLEVDKNLLRIGTRIRTLKSKPTTKPLPSQKTYVQDNMPELTRQSQGFAQEVTVMGRQLATIVQEMRAAVVSFELDAANIPPLAGGAAPAYRQGVPYEQVEEKKLPEGMRARSRL